MPRAKKPKIKCGIKSKCVHSTLPDKKECLDCTHNDLVIGQTDSFKAKPRMTPEEFHCLPTAKKLDIVVKMWFAMCSLEPMVVNGKIGRGYFMLRKHFQKESVGVLQVFYDWMYTLNERTPMTLTEGYVKSAHHQANLRQKSEAMEVEALPSLLSIIGGKL